MKIWRELFNSLFPSRCTLCDSSSSDIICKWCEPERETFDSRLVCERCGVRMTRYPGGPALCVSCQVWPPPFQLLRSQWVYTGAAEHAIKAYKFGRVKKLENYFAAVLAELWNKLEMGEASLFSVVAMPSTDQRIRKRGFAHTEMLSRRFARGTGARFIPMALGTIQGATTQIGLRAEERVENARGRFVAKNQQIKGQNIILIDDVLTTGASVWNASWTLLEAGAKSVTVLTLARSPKFHAGRMLEQRAFGGNYA